jgi:hypothetical protein
MALYDYYINNGYGVTDMSKTTAYSVIQDDEKLLRFARGSIRYNERREDQARTFMEKVGDILNGIPNTAPICKYSRQQIVTALRQIDKEDRNS